MSSVDLICMSQCVADRTDVKFYGGCKPGYRDAEARRWRVSPVCCKFS